MYRVLEAVEKAITPLGPGRWYQRYLWEGEWIGIIEHHPILGSESEEHEGGVLFDLPTTRVVMPHKPMAKVITLSPLSLAEVIECQRCGQRWWLRDDKWCDATSQLGSGTIHPDA
jgi:hypothetical protein